MKLRALHWILLLALSGTTALAAPTAPGGAFSLIGHGGKNVSDTDFRGNFMLIFFGYTHCPEICPIGLQTLAQTMKLLGANANKLQPIFISIDPQRDTAEIMASYVNHFHPRLLGLTGTPEQIRHVTNRFRVRYSRFYYMAPPSDDDKQIPEYSMDHTALMYLMGPDGDFIAAFDFGLPAEKLAARIQTNIGRYGSRNTQSKYTSNSHAGKGGS